MAKEDLASILPPAPNPEVNEDILRRSPLGSDDLRSLMSPSVATAQEEPNPVRALAVEGDPCGDEGDRVQELQRFILTECVQRKKKEASWVRPEAQLKESLEFTETHGHHNQKVTEAKSLDSIHKSPWADPIGKLESFAFWLAGVLAGDFPGFDPAKL